MTNLGLERLVQPVVSRTSCGFRRRLMRSCPEERSMPTMFKTFAIAAVLAVGTSAAAMAQYACPAGYGYYNRGVPPPGPPPPPPPSPPPPAAPPSPTLPRA